MTNIKTPSPFGRLVRKFREQRRWTQKGLALEANMTQEKVSAIELGGINITESILYAISAAFKLSPRQEERFERAAFISSATIRLDLAGLDESQRGELFEAWYSIQNSMAKRTA